MAAADTEHRKPGRPKRITCVPESTVPRVLIVDDQRAFGASTVAALNALGFRGTAVTSGEAALAVLPTELPAVVLIDLVLPGMNGWEVARRIGALDLPRRPRLVAITGMTDSVFRLRSMAAGFDDHLVKPIAMDALKRVLAAFR